MTASRGFYIAGSDAQALEAYKPEELVFDKGAARRGAKLLQIAGVTAGTPGVEKVLAASVALASRPNA